MKARIWSAIACVWWIALNLSAQTEAELNIQTCAGLTIIGEIGKVYSVDYVTDLIEPAESDWRCLEYLQLPASPYLWADKSAPASGRRFYRSVVMETPTNRVTSMGFARFGIRSASVIRTGTSRTSIFRWRR